MGRVVDVDSPETVDGGPSLGSLEIVLALIEHGGFHYSFDDEGWVVGLECGFEG